MRKLYDWYSKSPLMRKLYKESDLSGFFQFIVNIPFFLSWKFGAICEYFNSLPRRLGKKSKRYANLLELRNKYAQKRCFIACTGPSLSIQDLEKLKDEYVFGMNSLCMIHDKTSWKPDFFGIQDMSVYEKVKDYMATTDNGTVFIASEIADKYVLPDEWVQFHVSSSYHFFELARLKKYFVKFSNNSYATVYDGYSITYSIIQIAYYMGFDEIYLIGADCSYLGGKQHFIEHGHYDKNFATATDRLMVSYLKVKDFTATHNLKVYNSTRGGCLEIFERIELENVINKSEKNKCV